MSRENFEIAVMHGRSKDYKKIKKYIQECEFTPRILIEEYSANTIFDNLRDLIWEDVYCVVVLLTKDDLMKNGRRRARQNVVFELGYCFGAFDSLPSRASYKPKNAIIVIAEKGVELFSNIGGLVLIEYQVGQLDKKKDFIIEALEKSYKKAKSYYDL